MKPVPTETEQLDPGLVGQDPKVQVPLWGALLIAVIAPVPLSSNGPGEGHLLDLAVPRHSPGY